MVYSIEYATVICGEFPATTNRAMCIARGMKVVHEMVQPIVETKKMVKIMIVGWCLLCVAVALLLTMSMV